MGGNLDYDAQVPSKKGHSKARESTKSQVLRFSHLKVFRLDHNVLYFHKHLDFGDEMMRAKRVNKPCF